MGRIVSAKANWAVCAVPGCPMVAPGKTEYVPFDDILFDERGEREIALSWWHLVPTGDGGFQPDSIRGLIVPI